MQHVPTRANGPNIVRSETPDGRQRRRPYRREIGEGRPVPMSETVSADDPDVIRGGAPRRRECAIARRKSGPIAAVPVKARAAKRPDVRCTASPDHSETIALG